MQAIEEALEFRYVTVNGLQLHIVQAGPADGELVILLHGFPEFWYGWKDQIAPLVAAGYRVIVPDQRGYNRSAKPPGAGVYRLDRLAGDVIGLIDMAGRDQAVVIGHDWGAAVAWWTALAHPSRVKKLGILNVPHPHVMTKTVFRNPAQMLKSWYIAFFQLPWLPERAIRANDYQSGIQSLVNSSRPGTFTDADIAAYKEAWSQPRALTAMINWYRALSYNRRFSETDARVHCPTLILWGEQDKFLSKEMAPASAAMCDDVRLVMLPDATHWLHHEFPERISAEILAFLQK